MDRDANHFTHAQSDLENGDKHELCELFITERDSKRE